MSKVGEAWIGSEQKRVIETAVVSPLVPLISGLDRLSEGDRFKTIHEVPRALFPGYTFNTRKLGNPESDSRLLRLARKAMIDEIPQALDIWEGSMSLIGPRADKPEHIDRLFDVIPDSDLRDRWWEARSRQRPGIISSYAVHSHANNLAGDPEYVRFSEEEEIARNAILRATLDIHDFESASLRHDAGLIWTAARMAVGNYAHYTRNLVFAGSPVSQEA